MRQGFTGKAIGSNRRGSFQRTTLWASDKGAEAIGAEAGGDLAMMCNYLWYNSVPCLPLSACLGATAMVA